MEQFVDYMVVAFDHWHKFDARIAKELPGAHVSSLLYGALHTQIVGMKLFIAGLQTPAANCQRYVLESLATAVLVSKPSLGFLQRYMDNKYSTKNAIWDIKRNADALNLDKEALANVEMWWKLYSQFCHPTIMSAATLITHDPVNSRIVFGGCFDIHRAFAYDKEITSRVSLASILTNIVNLVELNYCGTEL